MRTIKYIDGSTRISTDSDSFVSLATWLRASLFEAPISARTALDEIVSMTYQSKTVTVVPSFSDLEYTELSFSDLEKRLESNGIRGIYFAGIGPEFRGMLMAKIDADAELYFMR